MNNSATLEHQGCRLAYRVVGQGVPILFIQGVGVHGDGWLPQINSLGSRFHCLTFDNRGLGCSQPIGASLSIELMAQDALALMDAVGWKSAHVVGHSMGGLIAQQLALAARSRVRSLALLCTFSRGRDATRLSPEMFWLGLRTRVGTRRQRQRAFLTLVMSPAALARADLDAVAKAYAPFFGHDLANQPAISMKQLGALNAYDATPRLTQLGGLPTLVVSATHDRIARPELGRALADRIPGARFVELPQASHGVPIEQPDRINDLLLEHLNRVEGSAV